jgi:hypothetical protein
MKAKRILEVVDQYEKRLQQTPSVRPKQFLSSGILPNRVDLFAHILWACAEIRRYVEEDRLVKAAKMLEFVRGSLWTAGIMAITQLTEDVGEDTDSAPSVGTNGKVGTSGKNPTTFS